jgi:hypothetical protein
MLRESATATDRPPDLTAVQDPASGGAVDHVAELAALVDAVVDDDPEAVTAARAAVVDRLGTEAAVDAVAIVANFEMMTRIADGTGAVHETVDADVARSTGADRFAAAP